MDNFEYSIQINDRDWEEFYSTAEECGLMQVSLATEEELWLSDAEQDDTTNSSLSNKAKFIRISLCPPPQEEEHPVLQISQPVDPQSVQTRNRCLCPSEDILSGSEDEEEFGSVTRFLCQKEYMLQKKESEQLKDIPLPISVDHYDVTNQMNKESKEKSLVEYMRTLNVGNNVQYNVDPQQDMSKTTMERGSNARVHPTEPMVCVQLDSDPRPSTNVNSVYNSPYCSHEIESCSSINGYLQGENIPNVSSGGGTIGQMYSIHEATLSEGFRKDNAFNAEHGMIDGPASPEEPPSSKHNGLIYYTMENDTLDNICQVAAEANVNSSAVEQNVPTSTIEELHVTRTDSLNIETTITSNTHSPEDYTTSAYSLVPVNNTTRACRHQTLAQPSSAFYRKTVLTLPEMYDFFFDDVSDKVFFDTEPNMASKEGIVYTPEMYEYFFLEDEQGNNAESKDGNSGQASSTDLALTSTASVDATWPEACEFFFADGPQDQGREGILLSIPSSQVQSAVDMIQSFVPRGLKGFTVRRTRHRRGPVGSLSPQDHQGTSEESSASTSGSIAPYLSPSRSDACLVFLAFASWAVKSSDLQSSDGWKTALLANIGAVSAIQYLRRRSRRTWHESSPESGDET